MHASSRLAAAADAESPKRAAVAAADVADDGAVAGAGAADGVWSWRRKQNPAHDPSAVCSPDVLGRSQYPRPIQSHHLPGCRTWLTQVNRCRDWFLQVTPEFVLKPNFVANEFNTLLTDAL